MSALTGPFSSFSRLRLRELSSIFNTKHFTLHITVGSIFSILVVVFGALLISYSYEKNKSNALVSAGELFAQVTKSTVNFVDQLYAPVETVVDLTVELEAADAETLEERLILLDYFVELLRKNSQIASIYIGYLDGDFFLVRSTQDNPEIRKTFAAPGNTEFIVQSIERSENQSPIYRTLYYDDKLGPLGEERGFISGYDPRLRGWFQAALNKDERITTDFYTFFTTREVGNTVARRLPSKRGVVGADLTVRSVSDRLKSQTLTASTEIIVFDVKGTLLAYPEWQRLQATPAVQARGRAVSAANISELGHPVVDLMFHDFSGGARDANLNLEHRGRKWLASITPFLFGHARTVYLSIIVPEDELLEELERVRRQSVFFSVIVLLGAIVVVWVSSRRVTAPVQLLARDAEAVGHLKFSPAKVVHSKIKEVDELAVAMQRMKSALRRYMRISRTISTTKDVNDLLDHTLDEFKDAASADKGVILLVSADGKTLEATGKPAVHSPIPLYDASGNLREECVEAYAAVNGESVVIGDVLTCDSFDMSASPVCQSSEGESQSLLVIPLKGRQDETLGLVELAAAIPTDASQTTAFGTAVVSYLEAIAANAAIALESQRLIDHLEARVIERTEDLEASNQQLRGLDRLKSMFIASMSHELRTPLNAIIGFSQVMVDGMSGPLNEIQQDQVQRVNTASQHLLSLIETIIDISKVEAGYATIKPEIIPISEVANQALDTMRSEAKRKGINLVLEVPKDAAIRSDRRALTQCLVNLVDNAVKYSEGGTVTVRAESEDGLMQIHVEDSGIGMQEDDLERIFDPFERINVNQRVSQQGSGLGLYVTRKIARELLNGDVTVTSRVNVGSKFSLRLTPLNEQDFLTE